MNNIPAENEISTIHEDEGHIPDPSISLVHSPIPKRPVSDTDTSTIVIEKEENSSKRLKNNEGEKVDTIGGHIGVVAEEATDIAVIAKDTVVEKTLAAKDMIFEKAKEAKDVLVDTAVAAKDTVVEKTVAAKDMIFEKATAAKDMTLEKASELKNAVTKEKEPQAVPNSELKQPESQ
jgi:hypothetical protein